MKANSNLKTYRAVQRRSTFLLNGMPFRFRRTEMRKRVTSTESDQVSERMKVARLTALTQLALIKTGRII